MCLLVRLRWVRQRLTAAVDARLALSVAALTRRWRETVARRRAAYDEALLKALTFRRWMLLRQTAMLTRLLVRDQMANLEAELASLAAPTDHPPPAPRHINNSAAEVFAEMHGGRADRAHALG